MNQPEFQEDSDLQAFYNEKMNKQLAVRPIDIVYELWYHFLNNIVFTPMEKAYNYLTSNDFLMWVNPQYVPVPPPQPPPMAPPLPKLKTTSSSPEDFEFVKA